MPTLPPPRPRASMLQRLLRLLLGGALTGCAVTHSAGDPGATGASQVDEPHAASGPSPAALDLLGGQTGSESSAPCEGKQGPLGATESGDAALNQSETENIFTTRGTYYGPDGLAAPASLMLTAVEAAYAVPRWDGTRETCSWILNFTGEVTLVSGAFNAVASAQVYAVSRKSAAARGSVTAATETSASEAATLTVEVSESAVSAWLTSSDGTSLGTYVAATGDAGQ